MRKLIVISLFMVSISSYADNYPGKSYICRNCSESNDFLDYMWAGLSRAELEDGFHVFIFNESSTKVVRVAIRRDFKKMGNMFLIERAGVVIGRIINYGPVHLDTLKWLKRQAASKYNLKVKSSGGGSGGFVRPPPPGCPSCGGGKYRD